MQKSSLWNTTAWVGCSLRGSATCLVFFAIELMSWCIQKVLRISSTKALTTLQEDVHCSPLATWTRAELEYETEKPKLPYTSGFKATPVDDHVQTFLLELWVEAKHV